MSSPSGERYSLPDLVALNDEMAALIRAGIPLEVGLDPGFSRRLEGLTARLRDRLQQGQALPEALAAESESVPPVYRAVVEAGLTSGRLPEALESMSEFALSLQELRRRVGLAFIYPCIVILVAFALFVAFVAFMVPRIGEFYRLFRLPTHTWLPLLEKLHETLPVWAPACLIVALLGLFWRGGSWTGSRAPWMWSILANFHRSTFARLLGLLVDHQVPLPQALRLAGEAAGDRSLARAAANLADHVAAGQSLSESLKTQRVFPPFMRWMISSGDQQGALNAALHQVAEVYRRRALFRADWFRIALPLALTVLLGGGAVMIYGLTLFLPLTDMLRDLTLEPI